jgi:hypothetical protein
VPNENNKSSMEDKRTEVMKILQDYFNRPTPLDEATDSLLRLFSVVGQSEQLTCPRCKSTNILNSDKDNDAQCIECAFIWPG